ncbi:Dehydrocurvularin biosynthesis regulator [Colletotrichum shisoi]|uniref:Dehydrocurvularin biosynthesis regulator n=1 Tax=Colletotrichum shisoi TaxID=2078593 RepID=A0A5Q4BNJ0_9PEZI|nr:Dehydrocurvularin biosynthesis regulator [Colletotrichum shisoi]
MLLIPPTRQKTRTAASKAGAVLEDVFLFLILLHLPHMLRPTGTKKCKCRTFACVNAAREFLDHYIRLRCANHVAFRCRCVNFSVFTASPGMLLARVGRWDRGANDNDASFCVH